MAEVNGSGHEPGNDNWEQRLMPATSRPFELTDDTLERLQRLTDTPTLSKLEAESVLARVAWSRMAEPGDMEAGRLLQAAWPVFAVLGVLEQGEMGSGPIVDRPLQARLRQRFDMESIEDDLVRAEAAGMRLLVPDAAGWPAQVNDLGSAAPPLLWVRGNPDLLAGRLVAVTGARSATSYGTHVAAEFAAGLAEDGFTVTSGGAYGVDAAALRAAISVDSPTVVVMGGGADRYVPSEHERLFDRIIEAGGAVVSQTPPQTAPTLSRMRARGWLMAALSQAVVIPEAGARSGSRALAVAAHELGRPVGAVPGPITSAASAGTATLIREGAATLVTNNLEVLELAESVPPRPKTPPAPQQHTVAQGLRTTQAGGEASEELDRARLVYLEGSHALTPRGHARTEEIVTHLVQQGAVIVGNAENQTARVAATAAARSGAAAVLLTDPEHPLSEQELAHWESQGVTVRTAEDGYSPDQLLGSVSSVVIPEAQDADDAPFARLMIERGPAPVAVLTDGAITARTSAFGRELLQQGTALGLIYSAEAGELHRDGPHRFLAQQLRHLTFTQRLQHLVESDRTSNFVRTRLDWLERHSPSVARFLEAFEQLDAEQTTVGGEVGLGLAEYRYLHQALSTPEDRAPETWWQCEAWARAQDGPAPAPPAAAPTVVHEVPA